MNRAVLQVTQRSITDDSINPILMRLPNNYYIVRVRNRWACLLTSIPGELARDAEKAVISSR
jgi:hypothetical protein